MGIGHSSVFPRPEEHGLTIRCDNGIPAASAAAGRTRVLIVDDDETTMRVLDGLLRGAGLDTLCARNLADAGKIAHSSDISLVLLDVHLPDGNGLDFCERFSVSSDIPVLFISGNTDVETKCGDSPPEASTTSRSRSPARRCSRASGRTCA